EPPPGSGTFRVTISDVTSKSGRGNYTGSATNPLDAAFLAASALAADNDYGRGQLAFRLPVDAPFGGQQHIFQNVNRGDALARQRLQDLSTVVGTVAIVVPGLNLAAVGLGAAVAAERLYRRHANDTLYFDQEAVNDVLGVLGGGIAASSGVQVLGKLQIVT